MKQKLSTRKNRDHRPKEEKIKTKAKIRKYSERLSLKKLKQVRITEGSIRIECDLKGEKEK